MIDFFDAIYSYKYNTFFNKIYFSKFIRFSIRIIANLFLPIYFILKKESYNKEKFKINFIVSITSFPNRINNVHLVIESIIRQDVNVANIILWLSKSELNYKTLPKKLLKLNEKKVIEIRFVDDNIKSHKKYLYALSEFKNSIIITLDDDVFYKSNTISSLIKAYYKFPNCIICNSSYYTIYDNVEYYEKWEQTKYKDIPSYNNFFVGIGGVLYPPNSLHHNVMNTNDLSIFCMDADDIWLKINALMNKTKVIYTGYESYFLPVINTNNIDLHLTNVNKNNNNLQIKNTRKYYINNYKTDPFILLNNYNE